jgi:hypothetical protein
MTNTELVTYYDNLAAGRNADAEAIEAVANEQAARAAVTAFHTDSTRQMVLDGIARLRRDAATVRTEAAHWTEVANEFRPAATIAA